MLCLIFLIVIYLCRVLSVVRYRRRADRERPELEAEEYLPASVIVYSQGDVDNLETLLFSLLTQDYPAPFEVIVVDEGHSREALDLASMLRAKYPNLYLTFTPPGVVCLSRKKLAVTLGMKAARYDIAVLTTTAVEIRSSQWLRRMMSQFSKNSPIEIVLGFASIDPEEDQLFGKRRRVFDYVADSARWLSAAIAHKPFRGTEYNLAYTRDVFMRNKGFHRSLNLRFGDDDIFISEIANSSNTAVELSEDSIVTLRNGNHPRIFGERVRHRCVTESHIRRRPRFLYPLTGWLQIIMIGLCVAAALIDLPNLLPAIVAAVLLIAMVVTDIVVWRKVMFALKARPLRLTIPWLSLMYPVRRVFRWMGCKISKQKQYTWN